MRGRKDLLLTFVALGATGALFGPALPVLADNVQVSPARASLAVAALFAGLIVGVGVLQWPGANPDRHVSLIRRLGAITQAAGLVLVPISPSLPLLLLAALLVGVGFGVSEATASAVVVTQPDGAGRLSGLGAAFAVSAILTPAIVSVSLEVGLGLRPVFILVAAVQLTAAWQVRTARLVPLAADGRGLTQPRSNTSPRAHAGWWIAGLLVLYVGAEVLLSTWVAELTRVLLGVTPSVAALAATVFWTCLALGRLAGVWAARRVAPEALLTSVLVGAGVAIGVAALTYPVSGVGALAALALAVVLIGPAYALALAVGDVVSAGGAVKTAARRVGIGALGGALMPLIVAPVAGRPVGVLATAAVLLVGAALLATRLRYHG